MSYNRTIPQPTDLIANSQPQLLANFQQIDSGITGTGTGFARNHVTITDNTNGGLHSRVDFYQAVSSPAIVGFVSSFYPKNVTYTGPVTYVEGFYKNGTSDIQVTNTSLVPASGEGWTAGGLQIRSGSCSSNGAGITNAFSKAFPTACVSVVITGSNTSQTSNIMKVSSFNASGFVAKSPLGEAGYFIATGY